jgi:hypothetical protein
MSYIISITRDNIPKEEKDVWEYLEKLKETENNNSAIDFVDLIKKIIVKFPCICDLDESQEDEAVWSDGPLIENAGENITTLGMVYSSVEYALPFVIEISNNSGFIVFDYQTGIMSKPGENTFEKENLLSKIENDDTYPEDMSFSKVKSEYQKEFKLFLSNNGYKKLKNGHGTFYTEVKNESQYSIYLAVTIFSDTFETTCHIGIGIVPIQKILQLSLDEELEGSQFYGSTLGSGINVYTGILNYRFTIKCIEDIKEWSNIVNDFYSKYAIVFFEKYNSVKAIDELLNSKPTEEVKLCDDLGWRIIKGLIAAKLINNPDYNNLRDYYKSVVLDRFQGHFMLNKCNKVISFLDLYDSMQLNSLAKQR